MTSVVSGICKYVAIPLGVSYVVVGPTISQYYEQDFEHFDNAYARFQEHAANVSDFGTLSSQSSYAKRGVEFAQLDTTAADYDEINARVLYVQKSAKYGLKVFNRNTFNNWRLSTLNRFGYVSTDRIEEAHRRALEMALFVAPCHASHQMYEKAEKETFGAMVDTTQWYPTLVKIFENSMQDYINVFTRVIEKPHLFDRGELEYIVHALEHRGEQDSNQLGNEDIHGVASTDRFLKNLRNALNDKN